MSKIKKTKDYGLFHFLKFNRGINPSHVANMAKSFQSIGNNTNLRPIIVKPLNKKYATKEYPDGKHEIYEGQHSFISLKFNNDWVWYIVDEKNQLRPEHLAMLQTARPWTYDDYMNHYCVLGFKEYAVYAGFKRRSGWSHNCVQILLAGNTKGISAAFKTGTFIMLRSVAEANAIIEMINDFSTHFKYYKARSFILSMLRIIENVDDYNHDRMMQKMDYLSERLVRCPDTESYIRLLEKLYNFKATGKYVRFI
mgnify:CR=1 FL=1